VRYYLSSLAVCALTLAKAARGHWSVENSCHWVLDVVFREDDSRVRTGHAAENLGLVRRLANSLLQQEKTARVGIQNKRLKAARSTEYLLKVINAQ
jgi:predicted transposase YbfD/YdcC